MNPLNERITYPASAARQEASSIDGTPCAFGPDLWTSLDSGFGVSSALILTLTQTRTRAQGRSTGGTPGG